MHPRASRRATRLLAAAAMVLALSGGLGPSVAATPQTVRIPHTVWVQPDVAAVDALGSWIGFANEPLAQPGQATPSYFFAQTFSFQNHAPGGVIGLATNGGNKAAVFAIIDANGNVNALAKPFAWIVGHFYLPLVVATGDGHATGWVYDLFADMWTPIATLGVPAAWGKLAPTSVTWASWTGPVQDSCAKYPLVDVYRYPSAAIVSGAGGPSLSVANATLHATLAGDCATSETVGPPPWVHSRLGT